MKIINSPSKVIVTSVALIFFAFSFSVISKSPENTSEPKTIEEMGPYLLKLIQKNDSLAYYKLLITKAELETIVNSSSMRKEEKESVMKEFYNGGFTEKNKKIFRNLVREFAKTGVSCTNPELLRNEIKIRMENKMETGKFRYEFICGNEKFELSCSDIVKLPGGLRLVSSLRFRSRKEVEEEMTRNYAMRDSLIADSTRMANAARAAYEMEMMIRDSLLADSVRSANEAARAKQNQKKGSKGSKGKK